MTTSERVLEQRLELQGGVVLYDKYRIGEAEGRVILITMNRPERLNALGGLLGAGIREGWQRYAADDSAWAAILTGAGRAFSAGADLKETAERRAGLLPPTEPPEIRMPAISPVVDVLGLWKPMIAAINGFALGGGFSTAMQCDIRIAAQSAQVGIPEARWNMPAGWMHALGRQMLLAHALEITMFGDERGRITAQRAYEIGWVSKVVPDDQLLDTAFDYAERCLYLAPRALRNFKQILYCTNHLDQLTGRYFASALEQNLAGMEDSLEGPRSFGEKRRPAFHNR